MKDCVQCNIRSPVISLLFLEFTLNDLAIKFAKASV